MESRYFDIDPIGTEDGLDEGSKGEKGTKDKSQSFGTSKWEERYHEQRRGVLKENCRWGEGSDGIRELSSAQIKFSMLVIQSSGDIKHNAGCMILELRKEVCNVALYCCYYWYRAS